MSNAIKGAGKIELTSKEVEPSSKEASANNLCCLTPPDMCFTKRESECFYLLSRGSTNKKIARILGLSPRTIEMYINQIKDKMGLFYKSELIERAIALMSGNLVNGE